MPCNSIANMPGRRDLDASVLKNTTEKLTLSFSFMYELVIAYQSERHNLDRFHISL